MQTLTIFFNVYTIFTQNSTGRLKQSGMLTGRLIIIKMNTIQHTMTFKFEAFSICTFRTILLKINRPDEHPRGSH